MSCHFTVRLPGRGKGTVHAVDDVDLAVARGTTLGLVGESGSGKSTLARLLLRLVPPTAGRVLLGGEDITDVKGARLRTLRRRMQLVFQDPYSSFDPLATIGAERGRGPGRPHRARTRRARAAASAELLDQVRLPAAFARRHPRQLSGGQLQRAAIARALATEPELLALDEPLSSLDVATQVQMVELLGDLQDRLGIAYLFISHDLNLVRSLSHQVAVMYLGRIVEEGPVDELYAAPHHPYTQALLSASPTHGPDPTAPTDRARGRHPLPAGPTEWLPLPDALPARHGGVRHGGADGQRGRRAHRALLPDRSTRARAGGARVDRSGSTPRTARRGGAWTTLRNCCRLREAAEGAAVLGTSAVSPMPS